MFGQQKWLSHSVKIDLPVGTGKSFHGIIKCVKPEFKNCV